MFDMIAVNKSTGDMVMARKVFEKSLQGVRGFNHPPHIEIGPTCAEIEKVLRVLYEFERTHVANGPIESTPQEDSAHFAKIAQAFRS